MLAFVYRGFAQFCCEARKKLLYKLDQSTLDGSLAFDNFKS